MVINLLLPIINDNSSELSRLVDDSRVGFARPGALVGEERYAPPRTPWKHGGTDVDVILLGGFNHI